MTARERFPAWVQFPGYPGHPTAYRWICACGDSGYANDEAQARVAISAHAAGGHGGAA